MAHDFVLCRTLRDCAAALDALHGPAPGEKYVIPPPARPFVEELSDAASPRLRIRFTVDAWSGAPVDAACRKAVEDAAGALAAAGHDVDEGSPEIDPEALHRALMTTWSAGLAHRALVLERALGHGPTEENVEACSLAMLRLGASLSALDLQDGYADCNAVGRGIGRFFADVDVLVLPSVARVPWRLGELDQDDASLDADGWVRKLFGDYVPFTAMFNVTGQPGISLPLAWADRGLPVGVQLVARYADEAALLRLAVELERAFPWADRVPPVSALAGAAAGTT
jgi:amidase